MRVELKLNVLTMLLMISADIRPVEPVELGSFYPTPSGFGFQQ